LSKIDDYLTDNIYVHMLSEMIGGVKRKVSGLRGRFPNWERRTRSCGYGKTLRRLWKENIETQVSVQRTDRNRQAELVVVDGSRLATGETAPPERKLGRATLESKIAAFGWASSYRLTSWWDMNEFEANKIAEACTLLEYLKYRFKKPDPSVPQQFY
jgi:hypothetical protein